MLEQHRFRQFERDVKLQGKRGKDLEKLKTIIQHLIEEKSLPDRNKDHVLSGTFAGYRECHIEPNWLLIYQREGNVIYFVRTGTHADLFD